MKKVIPADAVLVPDNAERKFKGEIFDVYQWPQQLFDGSMHTFEMLKRTDTVNVIAVVDGKIIVLEDEQPHLGKRISFPGGRVDPEDGDTLTAVQRETKEETGYSFNRWRLIKVSQPYRKIEWFVYTYVAWDVGAKEDIHLDPGEKIQLGLLEFSALKQQVMADTDYLGESRDIFGGLSSVEDLLDLPEYQGQTIDR